MESSDIRNAYFQAEPIDRDVLMRQPSGGLPDVDPEAMLLIRVYLFMDSAIAEEDSGTKSRQRGKICGFSGQQDLPRVLLFPRERRVVWVLATHVDDFLSAFIRGGGKIIDKLLTKLEVRRREQGRLRFCDKQVDKSGNDVLLTSPTTPIRQRT